MSFKLIKYLPILLCFVMEQSYLSVSLDFCIQFINFPRIVSGEKTGGMSGQKIEKCDQTDMVILKAMVHALGNQSFWAFKYWALFC